MMEEPLAIETRGLTKTFGGFPALRGLDLRVPAGETLAIFGPNGAGKTTLIKILAGVLRPSSGQILIQGEAFKDSTAHLRVKIGVVAHQSYLYGSLSAGENLSFYAKMYGVKDSAPRVSEMLQLVGLTSRRHDRVAAFSRGMQQRLALGRALLHKPDILLLDEPETGLDQQALDAMWQIIRADSTRRTVIFTSHNFERALGACGRVAILSRGQLAFTEQSCRLDLPRLRQAYQECVGVKR
jgi:heme exporter protein A